MTGESAEAEVPQAELSRLKQLLLRGDPENPLVHMDVIQEMTRIGPGAESLVPVVLDQYSAGKLRASISSMADLYLAFPRPEILDALRETGDLLRLGMDKKCELLKWGVTEVEEGLLDYLWSTWKKREPWRAIIVQALELGGTARALETLEAIRPEAASLVPEKRVVVERQEEEAEAEDVLGRAELAADESFLDILREAIARIRDRLLDGVQGEVSHEGEGSC